MKKILFSIMCVVLLCTLAACNKSYDKAIGEFSSSNGSTLEIIEINDDSVTYEISIIGFPTVRRSDEFNFKEGSFTAYYSPNGVDIPLIYLIYNSDLECWKNQAILPELDFYKN